MYPLAGFPALASRRIALGTRYLFHTVCPYLGPHPNPSRRILLPSNHAPGYVPINPYVMSWMVVVGWEGGAVSDGTRLAPAPRLMALEFSVYDLFQSFTVGLHESDE